MPALRTPAAKGGRAVQGRPTTPLIATGPFGGLSAERVATLIARGLQRGGMPAAEELPLAGEEESPAKPLEPLAGHHLDARILDLQLVIEASSERALVAAGRTVARVI